MKRTKNFGVGCEWIGLLCIYYKYFIEFYLKFFQNVAFMLTRCYVCCIERKSRMYVLERYECKVRKFICENVERKYKIIDLFAGAGGLSNGFEQTGKFEVIGR